MDFWFVDKVVYDDQNQCRFFFFRDSRNSLPLVRQKCLLSNSGFFGSILKTWFEGLRGFRRISGEGVIECRKRHGRRKQNIGEYSFIHEELSQNGSKTGEQ